MSSVVVLVLAWNGQAYLRPCLSALAAQHYDDTCAVLVVDNGSTDDSVAIVRNEFPGVALLRNRSNLGFARGNNVGIRALLDGQAPAPIDFVPDSIVLLNQDTEVAPDWLARLVESLDRHPQTGIAGCKILFPDGVTLQHTGGQIIWPVANGMHRGTGEADTGQYDHEESVEFVTGAAMAVRRAVFEQIGLLDEGFSPAYYEDVDLCYRARAAGFAVMYVPAARLRHHETASLEGQSARHQRAYHRNRLRFVLKHSPLDRLLNEFGPAEQEEIARWSVANSLARKLAYLENMLALPDILRQRAESVRPPALQEQLVDMLRELHRAVVEEEQRRRAETAYRALASSLPPPPAPETDAAEEETDAAPVAAQDDTLALGIATEQLEVAAEEADNNGQGTVGLPPPAAAAAPPAYVAPVAQVPPAVDVAMVMRQVRRQINERQGRQIDQDLLHALDTANQQWNSIYEPLQLAPAASLTGRLWERLRQHLHHEVRGYLDRMIYRQTEFNSSVVRALNSLMRRSSFAASTAELESLRDEVIQLREQVRQLQELLERKP